MNVINVLAETPDRVRVLIEERSEEALSFKPAPDVFSLRENVLHLRDIDVEGYEVRSSGSSASPAHRFLTSTVPRWPASGTTTPSPWRRRWRLSPPPVRARSSGSVRSSPRIS